MQFSSWLDGVFRNGVPLWLGKPRKLCPFTGTAVCVRSSAKLCPAMVNKSLSLAHILPLVYPIATTTWLWEIMWFLHLWVWRYIFLSHILPWVKYKTRQLSIRFTFSGWDRHCRLLSWINALTFYQVEEAIPKVTMH